MLYLFDKQATYMRNILTLDGQQKRSAVKEDVFWVRVAEPRRQRQSTIESGIMQQEISLTLMTKSLLCEKMQADETIRFQNKTYSIVEIKETMLSHIRKGEKMFYIDLR
jgi:hypothetical protein